MATLAELVAAQAAALDRILAGRSYRIVAQGAEACHLVADDLTISFYWDCRDKWLGSTIEPHHVPEHPLDLSTSAERADTGHWMEARGSLWPIRRRGEMTASLLAEELARVEKVLAESFSDPVALRDALLFMAGYSLGYNNRLPSPADPPAQSFISRLWTRFFRPG